MSNPSAIDSLIPLHEELSRLLPLIGGITIIEYNGNDVQGSKGLHDYFLDNELSVNVVNRIIVCGKSSEKTNDNIELLRTLFPHLEPEMTRKDWDDTDFKVLNISDVLVFHMAGVVTGQAFDEHSGSSIRLHEIVKQTRNVYYACFLTHRSLNIYGNRRTKCLRAQLRITDFIRDDRFKNEPEPTTFCIEKQEYINTCQNTLIPKDLFFQCVEEAEHGCENCNLCQDYGKRKQCPFAQRKVAEFYRMGMYVPKDEKIAHQWEVMASRQGYKPARIQVADDLLNGYGCQQSSTSALEIYKCYAQENDEYCINCIIDLAEKSSNKNEKLAAIPYIAQLAMSGNEDMILKLSDAFQKGELGLPQDSVQQEEWIREGAENGNPRFVMAMAEMYESKEDWAGAYNWYKTLAEVCPEMVSDGKLEELEIRMLTHGSTDEEIAQKGMDYLYGYHGFERDTHLAFRCFNYAKEKEIPLAIGLLGQMFYFGIGMEREEPLGASLISLAAEKGDLLSKDLLVHDLFYSEYVKINWIVSVEETSEMEKFHYLEDCLLNAIKQELEANDSNPIAHYLMGNFSFLPDEDSFTEMKKAAELGYPPAQYRLAIMYRDGIGTPDDTFEYHRWIEISANNGHFEAAGEYGVMIFGNIWNRSNAFKYLKKAYDQGYEDTEAFWCLAQCYMNGFGTQKNEAIAYPMYIKVAEAGNADAQEKLCEGYFRGNDFLSKDYAECARWGEAALALGKKRVRFETAYSSSEIGKKDRAYELYLELAEEGNIAAMNNLGCLEKDESKAFNWFLKAADKGEYIAQKNVARYYRYGIATEKDEQKALDYYTKSANQGYLEAITELARLYRYGYCTEKNIEESIKWYEKAISKGHIESMLSLADLYIKELDDTPMAIHYYKQAAEKGNETAILKLGQIYEEGIGIETSSNTAVFWYRKAAINGNEEAKRKLKQLGANWIEDGKVEDGSNDGSDDSDFIDRDLLPF